MISTQVYSTQKLPIWLWPNLCSLDAPLVACGWQVLLARSYGVRLNPLATVGLALAVWSIYVLDRVLDGPGEGSFRHLFAAKHRLALVILVVAADAAFAVPLLRQLNRTAMVYGLGIGVICAIYLGAIGRLELPVKTMAMPLLFAAGVVLPIGIRQPILPLLSIGFVVSANVALLAKWERGESLSVVQRAVLFAAGGAMVVSASPYSTALGLGCWAMLSIDIFLRGAVSNLMLPVIADSSLALVAWALVLLARH